MGFEDDDSFFLWPLEEMIEGLVDLQEFTLKKITDPNSPQEYARHVRRVYDALLEKFPKDKDFVKQIVLKYVTNPIYASSNLKKNSSDGK